MIFTKEGDLSDEYYFTSFVGSLVLPKRGKIPSFKNFKLFHEKIKEIDYPIVIFTNAELKYEVFEKIVLEIEKLVKHKIWFYFCDSKDLGKNKDKTSFLERKPLPTMFQQFQEKSGYEITDETFFVGNLVGRILTDKSSEDLHFADNLGIGIKTPDELYFGISYQKPYENFNPLRLEENEMTKLEIPDEIKILLLRGQRGSGKTFYAKNYLPEFICLSKDEIGFVETEKITKKTIKEGGKVIIDKIHPGSDSWHYSLRLGEKYGVKVGILTLDTPEIILKHLRYHKFLEEDGNFIVSDGIYFKKYEEPTYRDGFSFIKSVNWSSHLSKIGKWYF